MGFLVKGKAAAAAADRKGQEALQAVLPVEGPASLLVCRQLVELAHQAVEGRVLPRFLKAMGKREEMEVARLQAAAQRRYVVA